MSLSNFTSKKHKGNNLSTKSDNLSPNRLTFTILGLLNEGKYPAQIARDLKISRQTVSRHMKTLKKRHYIKENYRTSYGVFELTERGRTAMELTTCHPTSQGARMASNQPPQFPVDIHCIKVALPILKDAVVPWEKKAFHNWNPQLKKVPIMGANFMKTPKSILLNIYAKKASNPNEIYRIITTHVVLAVSYLKESYGIEVDLASYRVSCVEYHMPDDRAQEFVNRGLYPRTDLGREAQKIGPDDRSRPAQAWIDNTPYEGRETNDLVHAQRYLEMPENVHGLFTMLLAKDGLVDAVKDLRNNWVIHKQWIDSGIETNMMLKDFLSTALRKITPKRKVGQSRIGEFV